MSQMNFTLPSDKTFKYSQPQKNPLNPLQNLLKTGSSTIMRDWEIIAENTFKIASNCQHCQSKSAIHIGLTKNWVVVASEQKYFTSAREVDRCSWPICNKAIKLSGKILNLESIMPRNKVTMKLIDSTASTSDLQLQNFKNEVLLEIQNCCEDKLIYSPCFENYGYNPRDRPELLRKFENKWQNILKNFESAEANLHLTDEKINSTMDIFNTYLEKNSITLLINDDEVGVSEKLSNICSEIGENLRLVDNKKYFRKVECEQGSGSNTCAPNLNLQSPIPIEEVGPRHSLQRRSTTLKQAAKRISNQIPPPPPPMPASTGSTGETHHFKNFIDQVWCFVALGPRRRVLMGFYTFRPDLLPSIK